MIFLTSVVSVQANFRSQFARSLSVNLNSLIECVPESFEKTNLNKISLFASNETNKKTKLYMYDFQMVHEPDTKCYKTENSYTCKWNDSYYVDIDLNDYSFKSKEGNVAKYSVKAKIYMDTQEDEKKAFCVVEAKSKSSLH